MIKQEQKLKMEVELEMIKRRIGTTGLQETDQEKNQGVEDSFPDSDELIARTELTISITEIIAVNELKEIQNLSKKAEGVIF